MHCDYDRLAAVLDALPQGFPRTQSNVEPDPSMLRVVPVGGAARREWILPYDDVKAFLENARSFNLIDCICRQQHNIVSERDCEYPLRTCLHFSTAEMPSTSASISQEEALAFLDQAEEIGLVHTVSNVGKGINFICNCCGCCCAILRGIAEFGQEHSVAHANYHLVVKAESCTGCGICQDRCHVAAVKLVDEISTVDVERCIGCGLCVTSCPTGVRELELKPEGEIIHPPADIGDWVRRRKQSRGLDSDSLRKD